MFQCDETKPVCSRCSKTGHECKYRDPADLLFRNQTASAAQKAEDNWRQRAKSTQRVSGESSKQTSNPSSSKSHSSSGASPPQGYDFEALQDFNNLTLTTSAIQPDLRQLAYERFMYDFVIFDPPGFDHTKGPSDAFMDFVPALYDNASEGSCIRTIAEAVFYANFYSRCNAPKARVLAEETVGKGLKMLQARIADKQLAPTDETLASANLMGVYEVCRFSRQCCEIAFVSTTAGVALILCPESHLTRTRWRIHRTQRWRQCIAQASFNRAVF